MSCLSSIISRKIKQICFGSSNQATILQFRRQRKTFAMMSAKQGDFKEIELQLPLGRIKGLERKTIYDEIFYAYEGVPYGQPPLGDLRFREPKPVEAWSGVRNCTDFTTIPVQYEQGCEDCLYLNVYSKTMSSKKKLPVMVFIYGGSFRQGDCTRAHYGPDYFMFEEVVLVLPNYRVGSLGFLSLSDPECQIPGNAGLKDQLLALEWIKKYIGYFNGDCNNITLIGESAGAFSTHLLMASKQTKGLFHKAILMSASALDLWGCAPPEDAAYKLATLHGYAGDNNDKCVLEYLRKLEPYQLSNDKGVLNHNAIFDGKLNAFVPTIEPYFSSKRVIDKTPLDMLHKTWSNNIPIMLGGASFEGLVVNPAKNDLSKSLEMLQNQTELLLPADIKRLHTPEELRSMGQSLYDIYFGKHVREREPWLQLLDLFSYKFFWHGIHRAVLSRLKFASAPTYLYRFDFDSPDFNLYRIKFCGPNSRGVSHADINAYLFLLRSSFKLETCSAEYQTIRRMVGMWTSFAANSNPNCSELGSTIWEPLKTNKPFRVLNISHDVEMIDMPEIDKLALWNSFYTKTELF